MPELTCLEICAGAGGQSLGLEQAGFSHVAAVDNDPDACATLRLNRPGWDVIQLDVRHFKGVDYRGVDLLAGGVPCPPFSIAGKQLGADDERDLFPQALRLVEECEPAAVMLENVRGLATARFAAYRERVIAPAARARVRGRLAGAQRERVRRPAAAPALHPGGGETRRYRSTSSGRPRPGRRPPSARPSATSWRPTAGPGPAPGPGRPTASARPWSAGPASTAAPTSARPGPARPGSGCASTAAGWPTPRPGRSTPPNHIPRLTLPMAAALQGFPRDWRFAGRKTAGYRQIGNAFPPPVARAVGTSIRSAIEAARCRAGPPAVRGLLTARPAAACPPGPP